MILISKTLDLSYFHVGAQQDLACHGEQKDVGVVSGFTRSLTHSQESEEEEGEGEDDNKLLRGREGTWRSLL